jgi:serine protease SohB
LEFLTDYGLFLAKTITFVAAIVVIITLAVSVGGRNKKSDKGHIEVTKLNEKFDHLRDSLRDAMLDDEEYKEFEKAEKKRLKEEKAQKKKAAKEATKTKGDEATSETVEAEKKRIFVLDFYGS